MTLSKIRNSISISYTNAKQQENIENSTTGRPSVDDIVLQGLDDIVLQGSKLRKCGSTS